MARLDEPQLVLFGLAAAAARNLLPPPVDLPLLRTVRGLMFERLSREAGVTLSVEARKLLVELEATDTTASLTSRLTRWTFGRAMPVFLLPDLLNHALFTFGAGALFARYLASHRPGIDGPVLDGVEAERVRAALRRTLTTMPVEQWVRLLASSSELFVGFERGTKGGLVQRYTQGLLGATKRLPGTWATVLEGAFAKNLAPR